MYYSSPFTSIIIWWCFFCSVAKLDLTLCKPMNCSMPGFPVLHCLPELCPLNQWCHPMISSCHPFSSFPQSFSASGAFPKSQLLESGGQSIGASASASVLLMNIQSWFPLEFIGLISLLSEGLSRGFSSTTVWKPQIFGVQSSLWFNSQICAWLLEKP